MAKTEVSIVIRPDTLLLLFFTLFFLPACESGKSYVSPMPVVLEYENLTKDTTDIRHAEILLDVRNNSEVASPKLIAAYEKGFAIYDASKHQIQVYTTDGTLTTTFGRNGKGPGEFQQAVVMKYMDGRLLVADSSRMIQYTFDLKGHLHHSQLLGPSFFGTTLEPVSPYTFIKPTNGNYEGLAKLTDAKEDREIYFGQVVVKNPGGIEYDKWVQETSNGKIPRFFKNSIGVSASPSYIYLFLRTQGILRQYDKDGNPNWEQPLKLPELTAEFERIVTENNKKDKRGFYLLNYLHQMIQHSDGVYLLLKTPPSYPATIIYINHQGSHMRWYRFNELPGTVDNFSLSPDGKWFYLLDSSNGILYKADLEEDK